MIQPVPAPSIVLRVRRWRKQSLNVSLSREADKWSCPPLRQAAFLGISATRGLVNGFGKYSPLVVARHDTVLGKKILGCHCRRLSQVFKWNNTHQQSFVVCACGKGADYIIIVLWRPAKSIQLPIRCCHHAQRSELQDLCRLLFDISAVLGPLASISYCCDDGRRERESTLLH